MLGVLSFELYQFGCKKTPFLSFPLSLYLKIDHWIPGMIHRRNGWIEADSVKENLSSVC